MDWGMMQDPQALVGKACVNTSLLVGSGGGSGGMVGNSNTNTNTNVDDQDSNSKHRDLSSTRKTMPCHRLLLRPRLRFGVAMSVMIVLSDAILRFSWLLRFVSSYMFVSHDAFVLCTQFLEVFRRSIWNLLRVEWENIKQKSKALKARDSLSDTEDEEDQVDQDTGTPTKMTSEQELVGLLLSSSTIGGGGVSGSSNNSANVNGTTLS